MTGRANPEHLNPEHPSPGGDPHRPPPQPPGGHTCRHCGELVVYHHLLGWIHARVGLYVCRTQPRQTGPPFLVATPPPGAAPVPGQ